MGVEFDKKLEQGRVAESAIAKWLINKGNCILPAYEKVLDDFKGPALYMPEGNFVSPDLLVFGLKGLYWVEAKHKTAFSWYRKDSCFVTGIDKHHFSDYLKISEKLKYPLWLLFLHKGGVAKDSPLSPSGLYGGEIIFLKGKINHESDKYGKNGMVYWSIDTLKKLANYSDLVDLK